MQRLVRVLHLKEQTGALKRYSVAHRLLRRNHPGWRKWQTRRLVSRVLGALRGRAGSSPAPGPTDRLSKCEGWNSHYGAEALCLCPIPRKTRE
jgi:hypothetical protein